MHFQEACIRYNKICTKLNEEDRHKHLLSKYQHLKQYLNELVIHYQLQNNYFAKEIGELNKMMSMERTNKKLGQRRNKESKISKT